MEAKEAIHNGEKVGIGHCAQCGEFFVVVVRNNDKLDCYSCSRPILKLNKDYTIYKT